MVYLVIIHDDQDKGVEIHTITPKDNYKKFIQKELKIEDGYKHQVYSTLKITFNPLKETNDNRN